MRNFCPIFFRKRNIFFSRNNTKINIFVPNPSPELLPPPPSLLLTPLARSSHPPTPYCLHPLLCAKLFARANRPHPPSSGPTGLGHTQASITIISHNSCSKKYLFLVQSTLSNCIFCQKKQKK